MKFIFSTVRSCTLGGLALLLTVSASAQGRAPSNEPKREDVEKDLADYRSGISKARSFAKNGNLVAAEEALRALNKSKPNTAAWNMTTALQLIELAEYVVHTGDSRHVNSIAERALVLLAQAEVLATEPRRRAVAKTLAGNIQERFLANRTAALASYRSAVQLNPTSKGTAKEAVDRLERVDENLKQRSGGK